MRTRSTSPIPSYSQQNQKKYYTREEVSQILRAMMQAKLAKVYEQLEEKQHMIRMLNQKLNRNDNFIQNSSKMIFQVSQRCERVSEMQYQSTVQLINKMLNDKLQQYWLSVQNKLDSIRVDTQDGIKKHHSNLQQKINKMLGQIKLQCEQNIQNFKKKNNTYWIKVKEALGKMNNRQTQAEQKLTAIGLQISKYEQQRQQNQKTLRELQNGQNTAKMLVQLKKSVNNVYKNFEIVLKLQESVKERYQKMGNQKICDKCLSTNQEAQALGTKNIANLNWNKGKTNKHDDIIILQYSVEQDTLSNHQIQNNVNYKKDAPYIASLSMPKDQNRSKSIGKTVFKEGSPLSPITGKLVETQNISNTIELFGNERYKQGHQTANTNYTTKNETHDWVDHEMYINSQNSYGDPISNQQSNSFQFHNSSNQGLGNSGGNSRFLFNPNNPASTSMLNFSLDCRKEMLESVRPRLIQMIEVKGLVKPLRVFLDQINYLKNQEGNYLFDLKGNMFKLMPSEFAELQKDRILQNAKKQDSNRRNKKNM